MIMARASHSSACALTSAIAAWYSDTYIIPRDFSTHTYNALSFLPPTRRQDSRYIATVGPFLRSHTGTVDSARCYNTSTIRGLSYQACHKCIDCINTLQGCYCKRVNSHHSMYWAYAVSVATRLQTVHTTHTAVSSHMYRQSHP
jgi:hypothetical protein